MEKNENALYFANFNFQLCCDVKGSKTVWWCKLISIIALTEKRKREKKKPSMRKTRYSRISYISCISIKGDETLPTMTEYLSQVGYSFIQVMHRLKNVRRLHSPRGLCVLTVSRKICLNANKMFRKKIKVPNEFNK